MDGRRGPERADAWQARPRGRASLGPGTPAAQNRLYSQDGTGQGTLTPPGCPGCSHCDHRPGSLTVPSTVHPFWIKVVYRRFTLLESAEKAKVHPRTECCPGLGLAVTCHPPHLNPVSFHPGHFTQTAGTTQNMTSFHGRILLEPCSGKSCLLSLALSSSETKVQTPIRAEPAQSGVLARMWTRAQDLGSSAVSY